jgi:TonB-dependent starch-binding outer membrane protein SusC
MRNAILLTAVFLFMYTWSFSQNVINGKVTDAKDGTPLAGVTVSVKGSTTVSQTLANGSFQITLQANEKTLIFSYVGFSNEEINVGNKKNISVSLSTADKKLQEVVVVAYGTQNKKEVTGSVVKVDAKQLEDIPLVSVDQMLQGKVAGLQSISTSGQPGAAQDIVIRGIGSISANAAPLFVVDGIPVNTGDFSGLTQTSNALAGLNPNDIESVTVLKDAASESVYGSRAANGVILINTKKGKVGRTLFRIDAETGTNSTAYFPDAGKPLNRKQFFDLTTEGILNAGGSQTDVDQITDALGINNGFNTDWFKTVQRKGLQRSFNASASGRDQKTTFYLSGGYFDQQASVVTNHSVHNLTR